MDNMSLNNATTAPFGHALNKSFATSVAVYFIFLASFGITSNVFLIYTIVTSKRLHTTTNTFIVNLAACDFITSASIITFDAEFLLRGYYTHGGSLCGFKEVALMFSLPSSVVNLLLLSMERLITVMFSFKRHKIFSKLNVTSIIVSAWIYTILVAIFPLMNSTDIVFVQDGFCWMQIPFAYVIYQLSVNFLIPLVGIIVINIFLFKVASKHEIEIRNQTYGSNRQQSMISFLAHMKAAKTVLLLVGVFTFCWLTFIILVTANVLCGICHPREVTWTGNVINYLSVALNPLLFGLRNKRIRREMYRKLPSCFQFGNTKSDSSKHETVVSYCHTSIDSANASLLRTQLIVNTSNRETAKNL